MSRGDIFLADLGEPVGHEQAFTRPVLVISAQRWLDTDPPVLTVVPLTRTRRPSPVHIEVEPGDSGLRETSYLKCEDLRAISPLRLRRRLGSLDPLSLATAETVVARLLGL